MFAFSSFAEVVVINLRLQHEFCSKYGNEDHSRKCQAIRTTTEPVEFELGSTNTKKIQLRQQRARAFVTLSKEKNRYNIKIQLEDTEISEAGHLRQALHISLNDISDPANLEEQIFKTEFIDYEWDASSNSARAVLILGGTNTEPLETPWGFQQNMLKSLLEGDSDVKVNKVGHDENGFDVRILAPQQTAQALATLFSGHISNSYSGGLSRKVETPDGILIPAETFPSDVDEAAQLFNDALSNNKYFINASNLGGLLTLAIKPMLIKAGTKYYSAEQIFRDFFDNVDNRLSNIPIFTNIKIYTQE
jgi:hypothetical protein